MLEVVSSNGSVAIVRKLIVLQNESWNSESSEPAETRLEEVVLRCKNFSVQFSAAGAVLEPRHAAADKKESQCLSGWESLRSLLVVLLTDLDNTYNPGHRRAVSDDKPVYSIETVSGSQNMSEITHTTTILPEIVCRQILSQVLDESIYQVEPGCSSEGRST